MRGKKKKERKERKKRKERKERKERRKKTKGQRQGQGKSSGMGDGQVKGARKECVCLRGRFRMFLGGFGKMKILMMCLLRSFHLEIRI